VRAQHANRVARVGFVDFAGENDRNGLDRARVFEGGTRGSPESKRLVVMRTIREYDVVRVTRLLDAARSFTGTESVARAPAVGDVATVCQEYQPTDPTARVAVEMVDSSGSTIWLADFERSELELVVDAAV
jgi:hypothetical protein